MNCSAKMESCAIKHDWQRVPLRLFCLTIASIPSEILLTSPLFPVLNMIMLRKAGATHMRQKQQRGPSCISNKHSRITLSKPHIFLTGAGNGALTTSPDYNLEEFPQFWNLKCDDWEDPAVWVEFLRRRKYVKRRLMIGADHFNRDPKKVSPPLEESRHEI